MLGISSIAISPPIILKEFYRTELCKVEENQPIENIAEL